MRRFRSERTIGLSDVDREGRLRLDVVARYLQDVASEDVTDVGRPPSRHFWVVRRTELEVVSPFRDDLRVELETWASGIAPTAAARRYTLRGDQGGHVEAESIWIHLDRDLRPLRLDEGFLEIYGPSAEGRRAVTRLTLPPPTVEPEREWPLRVVDVDRLGHVNNAAYWATVEEVWSGRLGGPLRAVMEYRKPIDLDERVELAHDGDHLWLVVGGEVRAAAILHVA
ncbi:MAG TPA: acyl-ACP thioesterase domain-containing protein [Gaiellaceae bacterium]|nr:acyl-ACP thioesterase domain-containing protein [Gaiellaceae bacterium]